MTNVTNIVISPLREEELELLGQMNRDWAKGRPLALHVERFALQQTGDAIYLFAWHQEQPVGHVLLVLTGPSKEPMRSALRNCAHISDLFVVPSHWSQGIGTTLMDEAEVLATRHGLIQIGLDVAIDNDRAMTLYERRGYKDLGFGERAVSWTYLDSEGQQQVQNDVLVYLVKLLSRSEGTMKTMEIGELSEKLIEALHLVEEDGETIELARQGQVVARLVPANHNPEDNNRGESLLTKLQGIQIEGPTDLTANQDRASGNTKTALSQRLAEIRDRTVASGEPLMDWEEIGQEVAERRGGGQVSEELWVFKRSGS